MGLAPPDARCALGFTACSQQLEQAFLLGFESPLGPVPFRASSRQSGFPPRKEQTAGFIAS